MKSIKLDQPHLILMVGAPGSGKSTFAQSFASGFNVPLIDFETIVPHARSIKSAEAIMYANLLELFKTHETIIVDADERGATQRTELVELARKHRYKVRMIWVQTDPMASGLRLIKRLGLNERDASSIDKVNQILARFVPPKATDNPIVISGRHTFPAQARSVLKKLTEARTQAATIRSPERPERSERPTPPVNRISIR